MPTRVAVVSDDRVVIECVTQLLGRDDTLDAFASTPVDAWPLLRSPDPQVVVIDHRAPEALDLCAACCRGPCAGALLISVPDEGGADVSALIAGARGILYARESLESIARAVRHVADGQVWGPRRVFADAWKRIRHEFEVRQAGEAAMASRLSAREREVLRFAAVGLANKEVAERLAISEATVKVHLSHIFQKLGLRGRGELAAAFHGIIRS